jgi:PAS domain S-box-containing protein
MRSKKQIDPSSDREQSIESLRSSEVRYRRLFEAAQDGILILDATTGRITDVNPFLVKLLGFTVSEMLDKTVGELSPFKDIESNKIMLDRLQRDGYVRYDNLPLETRDGHHIAVEFVCNVYGEDDSDVIQCNIRDITDRKKRQEELALLNICITNLNDVILITEGEPIDEPGPRIVFVNQAFERISGYSCASALGRSPRFLQGAKTDPEVLKEIRDALRTNQPIRRQIINYKADGTEYWMDVDIVPVFGDSGKCTHFAAIERDITESKKAEESLQLFRTLIDHSVDAIEVIDPETGRFLDVNEVAFTRLGYTRAEMLSLGIMDVLDSGDIALAKVGMAELREKGSRIVEARHRRKDGSTFPVEVSIQYAHLNRGYLIAIVRDITDRKAVEEQLLWKTAFFEAQVNSALDGIIVVDSNGQKVLQNQQMIDLWKPPTGVAHEDDHRRRLEWLTSQVKNSPAFAEKAAHLYSHPDEISRDELELIDGRVFDRYTAPVCGKDGRHYGRIWAYRDITDRKLAEVQIADQAALLDKARDAIVVRDLKGVILFWNKGAERMYGWTTDETKGKYVGDLVYSDSNQFKEINELTLKKGEWQGELEHLTKDGGRITTEARWTLIEDSAGQPKSVLSIDTDITERKKMEAQFMRAQRMESIGTLAGGIAHDLNNILAPIMMSIGILKTLSENPQAKSILDTIDISAKRGADIVRQVLSFARGLEGERTELQPKHLLNDLENIIKDTFPKDIRLQFFIPNDTWTILGDPTQVHQILLNLCVNARDAMPNGGSLVINVQNAVLDEHYAAMNIHAKAGRFVNITVTDTGTGMPPGVVDKIFEPFFTTKEVNKGTGLGLSTVMAIVKSHEGHVSVYSEPGKGTAFNIYLPAMEISSIARKEQSEEASLPRGNGETILVIDDEASILTITSQTLQAFGYRVLTAMDGADGVAVYAQHRKSIAVVITDMMMPIMDGPNTIRAIMRINPEVKMIAASGLNANGNVAKISGAGVKHFLTKPYTAGTLLRVIRTILDELRSHIPPN